MTFYPQVLRNRPRLVAGAVIGLVVGLLVPGTARPMIKLLVGWDSGLWVYLALIWTHMGLAHHSRVREIAQQDDEKASIVLAVVCTATVASIAAIVLELASAKNLGTASTIEHYLLTGATLIGAWFLIPTIFTLHYARLFYGSDSPQPPLAFPEDNPEPDYWDFLYFSFTIAVASQTADIGLRGSSMRRAVLAQALLSFYFNVAVLGLCVNIAAGLLGS
jgi:uncharacterized membrane protein